MRLPHSSNARGASPPVCRRSTTGSLTGVGVEVSFATAASGKGSAAPAGQQRLVVVAPTPGGPAEAAGIRPGDAILAIDGRPTADLSLYAAGGLLQGPEGSEVALRVAPAAGGSPRDVSLRRAPLTINPVDSALCGVAGGTAPEAADQRLGYIRIATFSKQTAEKAGSGSQDQTWMVEAPGRRRVACTPTAAPSSVPP